MNGRRGISSRVTTVVKQQAESPCDHHHDEAGPRRAPSQRFQKTVSHYSLYSGPSQTVRAVCVTVRGCGLGRGRVTMTQVGLITDGPFPLPMHAQLAITCSRVDSSRHPGRLGLCTPNYGFGPRPSDSDRPAVGPCLRIIQSHRTVLLCPA